MNRAVPILIILGLLAAVGSAATAEAASPKAVPTMTKEQVTSVMGNPKFIIIDVRQPKDWDASDSKIKGAVREDPSKISAWADKYPKNKKLLFYCA